MANRENMEKWLTALRSGDYQQGKGHLRVNDKYCCLGVACEVAIADGLDIESSISSSPCFHLTGAEYPDEVPHEGTIYTYDEEPGILPQKVADWLGLGDTLPSVLTADGYYMALSELNDREGWDFDKIADAIEKEFLTAEVTA